MEAFGREPLDRQSATIPRGQVYVIPERCKGCEICVHFCPREVLETSTSTNAKGYHLPRLIPGKESACVHCEFCSLICPEFAIFTREVVV